MVSSTPSESNTNTDAGDSLRPRVRGITKGQNTARLIKHTEKKLHVPIDKQFNAIVGSNSTKVANALGIQIRKKAPLEGVSKWSDIDSGTKSSIIHEVLGSFEIEGFGTENVDKVLNAKCQDLYKNWKSKAHSYYKKLMAEGKNPYANCFRTMNNTQWTYMIENVWNNNESFEKRSGINKKAREKVPYTHTMGSQSFTSAIHQISKDKDPEVPQPNIFSDFFKLTHTSKKTKEWINPRCEEDHAAIERLETESLVGGGEAILPQELSQSVFGKKTIFQRIGS